MRKTLFLSIALLVFPLTLAAQSKDLYSYKDGNIIPHREFFSSSTHDVSPLDTATTYIYEKVAEGFASDKNEPVTICFVGTSKTSADGAYDAVRIYSKSGKLLLERWGYNPLRSVEGQNMQPYCKARYIKVPLDNDAFALIFGGELFDGATEAPEMMIAVAKDTDAKVVFDRPAMAFKYSASPHFSMEFVEEMDWEANSLGNSDYPHANPLPSRTKHKIWKEGNMLKYVSWK